MKTIKYKAVLLFLVILVGISFVSALAIGNSIRIDITIDNSTTPNNFSENQTDDIDSEIDNDYIENQTDTTEPSETSSNSISSLFSEDSDSETDSGYVDDDYVDEGNIDNTGSVDETQDNSDDLITGAAVTANKGVSDNLKTGLSISTITLSAVFLSTLFIYKRKMNGENKIVKKHRKK